MIRRRPALVGACVLIMVLLIANTFFVRQKIPKVLEESGLEEELSQNGSCHTSVRARILSHESRSDREYLYCRILCIETSDLKALRHLSGKQLLSGMILIQTTNTNPAKTPLLCGYEVLAQGNAALGAHATNPGEMDFRAYDQRNGVLLHLTDAEVETITTRKSLTGLLDLVSQTLHASLQRVLPDEDAGMLSGILLGKREEMPSSLKNLYQEGGIAHILAISSLHIRLLALGIWHFLRRRGASFATCSITAGILITLFCLMSGMRASAFRALLIFLLWSLAQVLGRSTDLVTSLAIALTVTLLKDPGALWDPAVLLSYGCVLSICLLAEPLRQIFPLPGAPGTAFCCGWAVWLGTAPVVMYSFYQTAPWSVLVNMLVIPLLGILMTAGFLAALTGMVWTGAGRFLAGSCHYILLLFKNLCLLERKLPYGIWICGRPGIWQIGLYYLLFAGTCRLCLYLKNRKRGRRQTGVWKQTLLTVCLFLAGTAASLWMITWHPAGDLEIIFEDVGQGDGILIRKDHFTALVDCGSTSENGIWTYHMQKTLAYYGIDRLDYIFLTHGDRDHISGVSQMLDNYQNGLLWGESGGIRIGTVFTSAAASADQALLQCRQTCEKAGIAHQTFGAGSSIQSGGLEIRCLYPGKAEGSDVNENSMVLLLTYGQTSILLTGDIGFEAEEKLLGQEGVLALPTGITVLKTAHHGSRYSTSEDFLKRVQPLLSVISCAADNPFGHPADETVQRLSQAGSRVLCTRDAGAVMVRTDGRQVRYFSFTEKSR